MANKLTIKQKVEIALTKGMSLRELAKKYGVHHSCIADIQKESEELISRHWQEKAEHVGRPANKILPEQVEIDDLQKKNNELTHDLSISEMRIEFLELKLKWNDESFAEAKINKRKQLKKKKS